MPGRTVPLLDRLATKFTVGDGCWEWTASKGAQGYGQIRMGGRAGSLVNAHRVVYELLVGPIPEGLVLDHLCNNKSCVRPSHTEPVTQLENCRRALPGGRTWRSEITHCPQGHPYDEENTSRSGGSRKCRACARAYYHEHKAG